MSGQKTSLEASVICGDCVAEETADYRNCRWCSIENPAGCAAFKKWKKLTVELDVHGIKRESGA